MQYSEKGKGINYIILSIIIGTLVVFSLTACGKQNQDMFHIAGEDLSEEQSMVFGYIYTMEYNINDKTSLGEQYDNAQTYGEYYKQQLKDDIVDTMLLYQEAKEQKLSLSSEEKDQVDLDTEEFIAYYGKEFLEGREITSSDVETVYEMKTLAQKYLESYDVVEDEAEDSTDNLVVERYIKVRQVTFLTAQLDENGNYDMDDDGNIIMLDTASANDKKNQAEEFASNAKAGEDFDALIKEQGDSVIVADKYMKYDDLSEAYKKAVDGLSVNETSNPISFAYGYYVIKMLEQDGESYAQTIASHDLITTRTQKQEELIKQLRNSKIGNSTDYYEEAWDLIEIDAFIP